MISRQVRKEERIGKAFAVLVLNAGNENVFSTVTVVVVSSSPHIGALAVGLFVELLTSIILAILLDRSTKILIVKDCTSKVRRVVPFTSSITNFGQDGWNQKNSFA